MKAFTCAAIASAAFGVNLKASPSPLDKVTTLEDLKDLVSKTVIFPVDMVLDLPTIFKELE